MDDQKIVRLFWARHEAAIAETDAAYGRRLRALANRILGNLEDAEESVNDTYLKTSGEKQGISSYAQVCDLLVNWHIQTVVLPSITQTETRFDPYDTTKVDLSGIVNAKGGIG